MTPVLRLERGSAVKRYPLAGRFDVNAIARQADILRACGVAVPRMDLDAERNELRLPWIKGRTLRDMLRENGPIDRPQRFERYADGLRPVMDVLAGLHRAKVNPADLQRYNPFSHVDRRLETGSPTVKRLPERLARRAEECRRALGYTVKATSQICVIHGDFHAGQMILEGKTSKWWMLDLDDVALGCPEADLGNFAAHLVTSPDLYCSGVADGFDALSEILQEVYDDFVRVDCMRAFGAAALLRRGLKLSERGESHARVSEILSVCASLGF